MTEHKCESHPNDFYVHSDLDSSAPWMGRVTDSFKDVGEPLVEDEREHIILELGSIQLSFFYTETKSSWPENPAV